MTFFLRIRYWIEYFILRLIIALIRVMPLDTAVRFSAYWWGKLAAKGRRHERALANLAIAFPEKTEAEREAIAVEMWKNLGRVMAETMQMDRVLSRPENIEIVNEKNVEKVPRENGIRDWCVHALW